MATAAAGRDGEGADAVRLKTCSVSRANEEDFAPDTVLPVAWPCAAALSVRSCARTSESVVVGAEDVLNKSPSSMLAGRAGASLCERQTQFPLGSKRPLPLLHSPQSRTYLENQGCQCPAVNPKPTLLSRRADVLGCHVGQWKGLLTTCNPAPRPRRRISKRGWGRPDLPRRHHQRPACRYQTIPVLLSKCLFIPK